MAGNNLQRQLDQTLYNVGFLRRIAPNRINNLRLAGDPRQGTDYDRAGGKGGISDPTPIQAANLEQYHLLEQRIIDGIRQLYELSDHVLRLAQSAPSEVDTARIAEQQRCTGGMGMEGGDDPAPVGWGKVECRGVYEKATGHNQGLCSACIRRRNRWEEEHQQAAS